MRALRNSIMLALIVILLSSYTIPALTVDQHDSSGDDIPSVTLTSALVFDSVSGKDSAKKINDEAGIEVCSYDNGTLRFTGSVKITCSLTDADRSLFELNSEGQVNIVLEEGVDVKITYGTMNINTGLTIAAVSAEHCGNLSISGKGRLTIDAQYTTASDYRLEGIRTSGKLTVSECELYVFSTGGNAVTVNNSYVELNGCKATFSGSNVGIRINGSYTELRLFSCNVIANGPNGGFSKASDTHTMFTTGVNIYVSNDVNGSDKKSSDTPYGYRYVSIECFSSINIGDLEISGAAIGIGTAVILAIIALLLVINKKKTAKKGTVTCDDQPHVPVHQASGTEEHPVYNERYDGNAEISAAVISGTDSFMFIVDGRVCGYFGQQRAVFTVPAGPHKVEIEHNDPSRKSIFSKNLTLTNGNEFTVEKRFGGYSVKTK